MDIELPKQFEDEELFEDWMKKKIVEAIVKAISGTRAEYICLYTFAETADLYFIKDKIEEIEREKERIDREFDKPSEAVIDVLWRIYDELRRSYERKYESVDKKGERCKIGQEILCTCGNSRFEFVDGEIDSVCYDWRLFKCTNCGRHWKLKMECNDDGLRITFVEVDPNDFQGGNSA